MIGIDCTGSCKSNYHTIKTTTAPHLTLWPTVSDNYLVVHSHHFKHFQQENIVILKNKMLHEPTVMNQLSVKVQILNTIEQEELEDTKGAIRSRKSKDRQHNGPKDKRTNNDLQLQYEQCISWCNFLIHIIHI